MDWETASLYAYPILAALLLGLPALRLARQGKRDLARSVPAIGIMLIGVIVLLVWARRLWPQLGEYY